jgi:two-component sensor histidine kinase
MERDVSLRALEIDKRLAALEAAAEARTRDLEAALDQRTVLLHELDHRVKNNLQLISSLMQMQARRSDDPAVKLALGGMIERLNAVATVHRRLFQSEDVARFDLSEFVRDLVADLAGQAGRPELSFVCRLAPAQVPAAKAASLALLIGELVTNALRHAFPVGRAGRVTITIVKNNEGLRIEIADDGVGMGGDSGLAADEIQGFGLTIVELLGRQLQARITREDAVPGVRTTIVLPLANVRGEA